MESTCLPMNTVTFIGNCYILFITYANFNVSAYFL